MEDFDGVEGEDGEAAPAKEEKEAGEEGEVEPKRRVLECEVVQAPFQSLQQTLFCFFHALALRRLRKRDSIKGGGFFGFLKASLPLQPQRRLPKVDECKDGGQGENGGHCHGEPPV